MDGTLKQKLEHIASAVSEGRYRYSAHAAQQRIARHIKREEVEQVLTDGEIIEDYPAHHYGPACLIFGITQRGRVLHVVCSLRETVDIITLYEPDSKDWEEDLKTRKE